ncbi:MAG: hypothetical protein NTY02_19915 [Acidobacteria bacterium]|nr:hypothetical protein [Acidobacteriota bacterium]
MKSTMKLVAVAACVVATLVAPLLARADKFSGGGWTVTIGDDGSYTGCDAQNRCLRIESYDQQSQGAYVWSNGGYTYAMSPIDAGPRYRLTVRDPKDKVILRQVMSPAK